jgi:hypothetical protein
MRHWLPLTVAVGWTLLNAGKPLLIDDSAYYQFARQIAQHPLDPYGFEMIWYHRFEPAMNVLAPPVLPYYLGGLIALVGEQPLLWKLGLFPFVLLYCVSVSALARRFAPAAGAPVLLLVTTAPAILPSLNLMLDIPAQALSLAALVAWLQMLERRVCWPWALLAGTLAALAAQTKYTGLLAPATMLGMASLYAFTRHPRGQRLRVGLHTLVAVGVAVAGFAAVEALLAWRYGESHFLLHVRHAAHGTWADRLSAKMNLLAPLAGYMGGLMPALTVVGLVGLGGRWWWVGLGTALMLTGYGVVLFWPSAHSQVLGGTLAIETVVFGLNFFALLGVGVLVAGRLLWAGRGRWADWVLVGWLLGEVLGYLLLTPFPAARRIVGIVVVTTLLVGRLAGKVAGRRRGPLWLATGASAVVGLSFALFDWYDARPEPVGVARATAWIAQHTTAPAHVGTIGHWGWQYYAERAGWVQLEADTGRVELQPGDWFVWPQYRPHAQHLRVVAPTGPDGAWEYVPELGPPEFVYEWHDGVGVRTVAPFYGGHAPVERWTSPRIRVAVFRVRLPWRPISPD